MLSVLLKKKERSFWKNGIKDLNMSAVSIFTLNVYLLHLGFRESSYASRLGTFPVRDQLKPVSTVHLLQLQYAIL